MLIDYMQPYLYIIDMNCKNEFIVPYKYTVKYIDYEIFIQISEKIIHKM